MFTPEQIKELEAPLSRANVKEREQAGRKFSYIEAYHAENEANRIFGFSAWDRFTDYELIAEREQDGKHRVYYRAKVKIVVRSEGGEVTTREGCGYGSGIDKDLGQAHESALKEAESDAEKRALKTFGNPFGQALYDKNQTDVAAAPSAADFAIKGLKAYENDQAGFRKVWLENKDNWKRVLSPADYKRVVMVMQDIAGKWTKEPATDAPAEEVFA
jgi:DNA repair and recombination protein RAD52